jgi:hypothetical protein
VKKFTTALCVFTLGAAFVGQAAEAQPLVGSALAGLTDRNPLRVSAADRAAVATITLNRYHLFAARTTAGIEARALGKLGTITPMLKHPETATETTGFGPADMACLGSPCQTLKTAYQHPVYVNTTAAAVAANFGNPAGFLTDYSAGGFSHVNDQYVGDTAANRYPLSTATYATSTNLSGTFGQNDLYEIVHAVAVADKIPKNGGLTHVFHLFLPKGTNTCMDEGPCYSPANASSFAFCAYHDAVTFSDLGTILFTVEPYQGVAGCEIPVGGAYNVKAQPTAANDLMFSAASVLAHEETETITDPLINTGWRAEFTGIEGGQEIGDICEGQWAATAMDGVTWVTQLMYSNAYHACVNGS